MILSLFQDCAGVGHKCHFIKAVLFAFPPHFPTNFNKTQLKEGRMPLFCIKADGCKKGLLRYPKVAN